MNMNFKRKLPTPQDVKGMYPITEELAQIKAKNDKEIQDIFLGKSDKLALVIGPCSADREDAVLDYISRLAKVQEKVKDKIVIIPRIYTNKPRTTGDGYKGMLHQPNPNENPDMLKGLIAIRKLHMKAMEETGFSCADEMLYPENHRYLSDLLSYVAVGARSVEVRIISFIFSLSSFSRAVLSSVNLVIKRVICERSSSLLRRKSSLHISSLIFAILVRSRKESPV